VTEITVYYSWGAVVGLGAQYYEQAIASGYDYFDSSLLEIFDVIDALLPKGERLAYPLRVRRALERRHVPL
jgi:hypothetical protein